MANYLALNIVFIVIVVVLVAIMRKPLITKYKLGTLLVLITLTALFDNLIIWAGIVDYNPAHILGIKILYAPIEDFAYTIAAVILIPAVFEWRHNK